IPFTLDPASGALRGEQLPAIVLGASCDGFDQMRLLRKGDAYTFPADLQVGTPALIRCAGAYTTATAGTFNGLPLSDGICFRGTGNGVHCIIHRAEREGPARTGLENLELPAGFRRADPSV